MKKFKHLILASALACSLLSSTTVFADTIPDSIIEDNTDSEDLGISTYSERTGYVYKYNEKLNKIQRRLWSYTYGKWLGPWETVE